VSTVLPIADSDAMERLGERLGAQLRAGDLVALDGPLGAGKTTFTRGLGRALGIRGPVTSPTFVLARTHPSLVDGPPLVHVDAYRLNDPLELDDLDIDFAGSVVVVEWAAGMIDGLVGEWLAIEIERPAASADDDPDADGPRRVTITGRGDRWAGLALA
jgi:tRNA threonylcarbamoyl adenosine modification protein YjeE